MDNYVKAKKITSLQAEAKRLATRYQELIGLGEYEQAKLIIETLMTTHLQLMRTKYGSINI